MRQREPGWLSPGVPRSPSLASCLPLDSYVQENKSLSACLPCLLGYLRCSSSNTEAGSPSRKRMAFGTGDRTDFGGEGPAASETGALWAAGPPMAALEGRSQGQVEGVEPEGGQPSAWGPG